MPDLPVSSSLGPDRRGGSLSCPNQRGSTGRVAMASERRSGSTKEKWAREGLERGRKDRCIHSDSLIAQGCHPGSLGPLSVSVK